VTATRGALTEEERANAVRMRAMLTGRLLSDGLCTVVQLGIPPLLEGGPRPVDWLACRSGADESSLRRTLRSLAAFDVFVEPADGVFELTALGRTLCPDTSGSAAATVELLAGLAAGLLGRLTAAVRDGAPPPDRLCAEATVRAIAGIDRSLSTAEALSTLDLPVGGRLVELDPDTPGIPDGADVYLLAHVLRSCTDQRAEKLLRACRGAVPAKARLVVVELLAAERGRSDPGYRAASLMDLLLLAAVGSGGRERPASELCRLLDRAGFTVIRVNRLADGAGALEAVPTG
jgi:hypothetical protein